MTDPVDPAERSRFEKAARLYTDLGFSAERAVAQLCRGGFPQDWIRAQFPQVSLDAFPSSTAAPSTAPRRRRGPERVTPPSAQELLPAVLKKAAAPPRQDPPAAKEKPAVVVAAQAQDTDAISFQYVPLIQCSFPHADPGEVATFSRRNGWLELTLSTARPEMGLPYGVPARLLTIYCASEAIRTKSPEIFLGHSVNDFLRRLDVPVTRGERGSQRVYANQLMRLIHCAVSVDENVTDAAGRQGLHIRQALFAQEAQLWWDRDGAGEGSSLVLSPVLFESILERSAPLSTHAIRQLRKSPMDLDIYAWLVHRLFSLGKPSTVSWAQLSGQFGHGYRETRNFRQNFLGSLKRVQAAYPEARLNVTDAGLLLLPSKSHVPRQTALAAR